MSHCESRYDDGGPRGGGWSLVAVVLLLAAALGCLATGFAVGFRTGWGAATLGWTMALVNFVAWARRP